MASYRDHFIAHSLTSPLADHPVDNDVHVLLDETVRLVESGHSIVFGRDLALADWHRLNAEYARRLWASVRVGQVLTLERQRTRGRRVADWLPLSD